MAQLELWYPAKPWTVTQGWGVFNPAYLQFGFDHHNGIDFLPAADKVLRCPVKNLVVYDVGYNDATGWRVKGNTADSYDFPDGKLCRINMVFMHLEKQSDVKIGDVLRVGDSLGIADNTGFSTGPHTHWLCRRVDKDLNLIDKNNADNSFDQTPYFNGLYAADFLSLSALFEKLKAALAGLLDKLKK